MNAVYVACRTQFRNVAPLDLSFGRPAQYGYEFDAIVGSVLQQALGCDHNVELAHALEFRG